LVLFAVCLKEEAREGHFMVMVVLEAVVRAVLAKEEFLDVVVVLETLSKAVVGRDRGEQEGMVATVCRRLLQILMLNWSSIMHQQ
jgi:hypothetical protein